MPTILVADDDQHIRDLLVTCIRDLGHTVEAAVDGDAAWQHLGEKHFDLVLLDVCMPGLNGLAWLRRIREHHPGIAVVLMTAYATVPQAVEAMRLGAYEYLMKPFSPDDVRLLISHVLELQALRGRSATTIHQREIPQSEGSDDDSDQSPNAADPGLDLPLREIERRRIEQVIEKSATLNAAAARLGINPATLWRKRKRYGMH